MEGRDTLRHRTERRQQLRVRGDLSNRRGGREIGRGLSAYARTDAVHFMVA
jgi:hypothetical protein